MPATIVDVARRAGVSTATVSRVLQGSPVVRETTRERVQRAVTELSYAPSAIARGLVTRRTRGIGLVITTIADPFFPDIVRGVEETALDNGYGVFLCNSNNDPDRELAVVRLLWERRADAIVVAASRVGSFYHAHLQRIKVPLVLINNQQSGDYTYSVATDDVGGGHLATSYLLGLGHRCIAYIHGPSANYATFRRHQGYEAALREGGITPDPAAVVQSNGSTQGGAQAMGELLQRRPRPTAVFCYNDMTAIGAMRAIRAAGLRVPTDISVMGYDDVALAAYVHPPLTTIAQQKYELGRRAMLLALELLAHPSQEPASAGTVSNVLLSATLVERESCAPPVLSQPNRSV